MHNKQERLYNETDLAISPRHFLETVWLYSSGTTLVVGTVCF